MQGLVNVVMDKDGKLFFDGAEVDRGASCRRRSTEALEKDQETRAIISADQSLQLRPGDATSSTW